MKTCSKCKMEKPESDFYLRSVVTGKRHPACKKCHLDYHVENRKEILARKKTRYWLNPEKFRKIAREQSPEKKKSAHLKSTYEMSLETYNAMFLEQAGKCAICKEDEGKRSLCVDHDHATGKVRALICASCNTGLGRFKDSAEIVQAAADYLRRHA